MATAIGRSRRVVLLQQAAETRDGTGAEQRRRTAANEANHLGQHDFEIDGARQTHRFGQPGVLIVGLSRPGRADAGMDDDADACRRAPPGCSDMRRLHAAASRCSGFLVRIEQLYLHRRHHRRDRMLVDQLRMPVASQQHRELIEPGDDSLQLNAIDEEDRDWRLVLPDVIQEDILNIL